MDTPDSRPARHYTKDKGDIGVACVIADLSGVLRQSFDFCGYPKQWPTLWGRSAFPHGAFGRIVTALIPGVTTPATTTLRILDSRNAQKLGVRMADHFTDPHLAPPEPP